MSSQIAKSRSQTKELARSLKKTDVFNWLITHGYFPENYVLPPCFVVSKIPEKPKVFYKPKNSGKKYSPDRTECAKVHFPKSDLTDREFGIIDPYIHNDIAFIISSNWKAIIDSMIPSDSIVASYSFPVPVDAKYPGRLGFLRSGRMIYEFIEMTEEDLVSCAYQYSHLVKADIKSFYPSIYTHSIAWAIHGKKNVRKPQNIHNIKLIGNKLDKLFQNANDGCTNGIPIGPAVSDIIAEIIASGVDRLLTKKIKEAGIQCEATRFKDDYRVLVKSEEDGRAIIKHLQYALKEYNLELSDEKTKITKLPDGLFRPWVSKYHAIHPQKLWKYSWKQFREVYLGVIEIDKEFPGTGVIDRFLSDIVSKKGNLKVEVYASNLEKIISMLLMLARLRIKSFPKVIAIIESVIKKYSNKEFSKNALSYLASYLESLSEDESRNKYLISWLSYFFVSNKMESYLKSKPSLSDPITKSILNNRGAIFKDKKEFKLFTGSVTVSKNLSMMQHLEIFSSTQKSISES